MLYAVEHTEDMNTESKSYQQKAAEYDGPPRSDYPPLLRTPAMDRMPERVSVIFERPAEDDLDTSVTVERGTWGYQLNVDGGLGMLTFDEVRELRDALSAELDRRDGVAGGFR